MLPGMLHNPDRGTRTRLGHAPHTRCKHQRAVARRALSHGARSLASRSRLLAAGGFPIILGFIFSDDSVTVVYALGAVQNYCSELEAVLIMQRATGVFPRLQVIAHADHT